MPTPPKPAANRSVVFDFGNNFAGVRRGSTPARVPYAEASNGAVAGAGPRSGSHRPDPRPRPSKRHAAAAQACELRVEGAGLGAIKGLALELRYGEARGLP